MEFQLSYFKSWKMMLWKCCTQYASKFGKLSSGHRTGKVSFHSNPKERQCQRMLKLPHTQFHSSHMLVNQCSKSSKPGFSSMWTVNFQMLKLVLEKQRNQKWNYQHSLNDQKKQESSRKTAISSLSTMPKPLTMWITINCGKFWKRWEYQTAWPASWETSMQVRKQLLELGMEQHTGSK